MKKMNYEQFKELVKEEIKNYLPERYANASVDIRNIIKNNDLELVSLVVCNDKKISPNIYLDEYYNRYKKGDDIEEILIDIAKMRIAKEVNGCFPLDRIMDFEKAKNFIITKLIEKDWNKKLLQKRPHKLFCNLAVTYHIIISIEDKGISSAPITNELLNQWNENIDTVHELSIINMKSLFPSIFEPIDKIISSKLKESNRENETLGFLHDYKMYVLSNHENYFGAAALLDKEIVQKMIDEFGTKFYILPSSVHEVIVVDSRCIDVGELSCMVKNVNHSILPYEERLSNNIYRYDVDNGLCLVA